MTTCYLLLCKNPTVHLIKEIFVSFESSKESCMSLECVEMVANVKR